ncbi:MAG: hypothetical protein IKZ28_02780 [Clostridia bacterium]|nr:hypothetical protein [Clostridia bacterium]
MKKKLSFLLASVMTLGAIFSLSSCNKISKLYPYEGNYNLITSDFNGVLPNTSTYETTDTESNGLIVLRNDSGYYEIVDLMAGTKLNVGTSPVYSLDDGLFYTTNDDDTYTLYYNTEKLQDHIKGAIDDSIFYKESGERIYINVDGDAITESNPFKEILPKKEALKVGKYYVSQDSSTFKIFDKKANYVRTIDLYLDGKIPKDAEISASWTIKEKYFFQTKRELPVTNKKYTYSLDGIKYELKTYSYNVKNGNLRELKNFKYSVANRGYALSNDKAELLQVQEIKDKSITSTPYLQSFNKFGFIYSNVQKIVPGAKYISYTGNYTIITDAYGDRHVFDENKKLVTLKDEMSICGGYVYALLNGNLILYNAKTQNPSNIIKGVKNLNANTEYGKLAFIKDDMFHLYDCAGTSDVRLNCDSYTVSYNYYVVTSGATKTIVFSNGEYVSNLQSCTSLGSSYADETRYELFKLVTSDNKTNYRVVIETSPSLKD